MHPFLKRQIPIRIPLYKAMPMHRSKEKAWNCERKSGKNNSFSIISIRFYSNSAPSKEISKLFSQIPPTATTPLLVLKIAFTPPAKLWKNVSYLIVCTSFSSTNSSIWGLKTTSLVSVFSINSLRGDDASRLHTKYKSWSIHMKC